MRGQELKDREYRLKKFKGGYFPQVRMKPEWFFIWGVWKTIAKHPGDDYGLYPGNHHSYPKTYDEAKQICKDFDDWFKETSVAKWTYSNVNI